MSTPKTEKLTQAQSAVLRTLYDVAAHEGGTKTLKNRYHSAAMALIRRGFVIKHEDGFYRPRYEITDAGKQFWRTYSPDSARQSDESGRRYNEERKAK